MVKVSEGVRKGAFAVYANADSCSTAVIQGLDPAPAMHQRRKPYAAGIPAPLTTDRPVLVAWILECQKEEVDRMALCLVSISSEKQKHVLEALRNARRTNKGWVMVPRGCWIDPNVKTEPQHAAERKKVEVGLHPEWISGGLVINRLPFASGRNFQPPGSIVQNAVDDRSEN